MIYPLIKCIIIYWDSVANAKLVLTLFVTSLLAGCSIFGVYKVDIPQGTPLTKAQASQVQVGMNFQQVRFLLGSPTVTDPLNPQRWDYIYNYIPGTYAKKAKIPRSTWSAFKNLL